MHRLGNVWTCVLVYGLTVWLSLPSVPLRADEPPNIVIILADDMGYGDPACFNPDGKISTPNIDSLARDGMRFTDAHSPGAVCIPTRYGLLTGQYPMRAALNVRQEPGIPEDTLTLPALLKQQGYSTGMIGKWHLGFEGGINQPFTGALHGGPMDRGFTSFFGIHASLDIPPYFYIRGRHAVQPPSSTVEASSSHGWSPIQGAFWRAGQMSPGFQHEQVLPTFKRECIEHLKASGDQPFLLYVALPAPHTPWLPLAEFRGKSKVGMYGDFVMQVDALVGAVLGVLDDQGLTENTLVLFTSDNGPVWYPTDVRRFGHSATGPFRGMKADAWEGGHRVPFVVRWPGTIKPETSCASLVCQIDLFATIADAVGILVPEGAASDSRSMLPAFRDPAKSVRETLILKRNASVIRQGPWKLITHMGSGGFSKPRRIPPAADGPQGQLFHLAQDPSETHNLWQEHPDKVAELEKLLRQQQ